MKKNEIWFVSSSQIPTPPLKGGAIEKLIYDLYNILNKRFHVKLVSISKTSDAEYEIIPSTHLKFPLSIFYDFYWGIKLAARIENKKPDVVVLNTPFVAIIPVLVRFLYPSVKFIYVSHNPSWTVPDKELGILNRIIKKIEKFVMNGVDRIVAIANAMKIGFVKYGVNEKKIEVIHNFVNTDTFKPRGYEWKKKHGIRKMVLFVGKLTETKGVSSLIRVISNVVKQLPDAKFVFVGGSYYGRSDNPYIWLIDKLKIKKHILFTGSVSEEELLDIYSSADLLVLPTKREGLPRVILEALASGVPVVASNISGIPEVVDNDVGLLVERNNENELKQGIIKILKYGKKLRKNARKRAIKFSLRKISKKWMKFINGVINNEGD